jgi:nitrate reductase cytochrome c-type subunit
LFTGARSETVQGTRYYCLLCHMPQSAETPLR